MDSHFGKSMRTHRGSGPTPEDWSDLTRELEQERARSQQIEAQLYQKSMVLNEMTRLQEELYSNLDELQTRINELQSKKVRAEESRWRSKGELDKAKKAYRALKSDLEAEATKTATLSERNRALKSDRKTLTKTVKSLEGQLQDTVEKLRTAEEHIAQTTQIDKQTEAYYLNEIDSLARENNLLESRVQDLQLACDGLRSGAPPTATDKPHTTNDSQELVSNLGRLIADCESIAETPTTTQIWTWVQRLVSEYFAVKADCIELREIVSRIGQKIEIAKLVQQRETTMSAAQQHETNDAVLQAESIDLEKSPRSPTTERTSSGATRLEKGSELTVI